MPVISVFIQKGGCGKTTTTINLAAALQRRDRKILLVDADPQASLTTALDVNKKSVNLYSELIKEIKGGESDIGRALVTTRSGLHLIPASAELSNAEIELAGAYGREYMFKWMMEKIRADYDFVFIDCPPSIGLLTVNALLASDYILMPLEAEFLPLQGIESFMPHLKFLTRLNKNLEILGFVLTRYDERKIMNRQINQLLRARFPEKAFQTRIRNNIRLAKAQESGLDIFNYDCRSHGAEDYFSLANEFLTRLQFQNEKIEPAGLPSVNEVLISQ